MQLWHLSFLPLKNGCKSDLRVIKGGTSERWHQVEGCSEGSAGLKRSSAWDCTWSKVVGCLQQWSPKCGACTAESAVKIHNWQDN